MRRRPVDDTVHGAKERGPHFVHKTEDDTGGWQLIVDQVSLTPYDAAQNNYQIYSRSGFM